MNKNHYPLEPDSEEMQSLTRQVLDFLVQNTEGLDKSPASLNSPSAELLNEVARVPPELPVNLENLLDLVRRAAEQSFQTAGPSYMAYIPTGGIFTSALAGFLANGINRYTGKVSTAPALVAMEESVLRWLCDLFDYPADAQAVLTSGGSMSNLLAIATARDLYADGSVDRAVVYVGEHGHGSVAKAARTAGVARHHIKVVQSTPDLRLHTGHLLELIRADRENGLIPICVCAAAGTTNTGTIDDLAEIASIAKQNDIWLHIDGAYGGLFQLTERGKQRIKGIEQADSIALDPHKTLFLPFGVGALIVKSREFLQRTFSETAADYMQDLGDAGSLPDFDNLTPELSREFRGLRLWLPLHLHGVDAFRQQLDEKLDLIDHAYAVLSEDPRLEVPWSPEITVVVFRIKGRDDEEQLHFLDRINQTQRVMLSSTRIDGRVYLRIAILSVRTHRDRVDEALDIILGAIE